MASLSSQTLDKIRYYWLIEYFLPLIAPRGKDQQLLIIDSHKSHLIDQFLTSYIIKRVFITLLPSYTFYITQPLDVSYFTPLKQYFRSTLLDLRGQDFKAVITKQNFLTAYYYTQKEAFTIYNIRAIQRASGLQPVNINQVLQNPFVEAAAAKTPLAPLLTMEYKAQGVATLKGGKELRNLMFCIW